MGFIGAAINMATTGFSNQQNNEFAAEQAELDRKFQAEQAELARQFQMDFYDTRQSPEAQLDSQMAGYEKHGINPALMYGKSAPTGGSAPSTPIPGGSTARPVGHPLQSSFNLLQDMKTIWEMGEIKTTIDLKNQQINESVIRSFGELVAGNINLVNLSELNQTSEHRVNAAISEYKSTKLDWELYEKNKETFDAAIKWNNQISEQNYLKTKAEIDAIKAKTGLDTANAEYLEALKFGQTLANEINEALKSDTIRNSDSKLDLDALINKTRQTYIAKTGIDPFTFDSFKVMLMNSLQPYVKSNDTETYESLLRTIDPHSAANVALSLSHDITEMIGTAAGVAVGAKQGKGGSPASVPYPAATNSTYYVD